MIQAQSMRKVIGSKRNKYRANNQDDCTKGLDLRHNHLLYYLRRGAVTWMKDRNFNKLCRNKRNHKRKIC